MKTLYVSDLDGTLLNPQAELSPSTAEKLNQLIHQGLSFSAATARTWETVQYLLQDVQLSLPLVLMNGVCLFDPVEKNYIHVSTIAREPLERLFCAMEQAGVHGFLYQIQGKRMIVSYEAIDHAAMEEFMEERRRKYNKQFVQTESFRKTAKPWRTT